MLEAKLQRVLRNLHPLVCEMGNHGGFEEVGAGYDFRSGLLRMFTYWWPCWAFAEARRLSLAAGRGCSLVAASGFSCCGARRAGFSSPGAQPAVWGIFSDQGSNPRPLHWQGDSQPLHHQWRPKTFIYYMAGTVPAVLHSSAQLVFTTVSNKL